MVASGVYILLAAGRPLFTGSVEHSLDDKGRLVVPARFRERLGAGFFLTIAPTDDPCLALYPPATWVELCALLEAVPDKNASYRSFVRFFFAHTDELSCDAQGRLMIPAALRSYAKIEKDVVSLGSNTRVEIWARERYEQQPVDAGDIRAYASGLGLP